MKTKRRSLSKKLRFDLFKRDEFTCQYCGSTPPKVVLEVDHIKPVSQGGDNDIDNLVTSCFDCNRGKGSRTLDVAPDTVQRKREKLMEREEQIKAFERAKKRKSRRINKAIKQVEEVFQEDYPNKRFKRSFNPSMTKFVEAIDIQTLQDAMAKACNVTQGSNDAIRYFCGICWNLIKGEDR